MKSVTSAKCLKMNTLSKIFFSVLLCLYQDFIWARCKDLQLQRKKQLVFYVSGTMKIFRKKEIPNFFCEEEYTCVFACLFI